MQFQEEDKSNHILDRLKNIRSKRTFFGCTIWVNVYVAGKESTYNVGDLGSIPRLGRSPGERKCYPLQYSCLDNSMDSIVHGVTKSWTQLSAFHFLLTINSLQSQVMSTYYVIQDWPPTLPLCSPCFRCRLLTTPWTHPDVSRFHGCTIHVTGSFHIILLFFA